MTLLQEVSRFLHSAQPFDYTAPPRSKRDHHGFEFAGESSSTVVEVRSRRGPPLTPPPSQQPILAGGSNMGIRKEDSSNNKNPSSLSCSLAWWLSSLVCGISTALVYSLWVDYRQRHRKSHLHRVQQQQTVSRTLLVDDETARDDDDNDDSQYCYHYCNRIRNYMLTQSRHVAQNMKEHLQENKRAWMDVGAHLFFGSVLWGMLEGSSSSTSSNRQGAAATPPPLLVLGGGGILGGFLFLRQSSIFPLRKCGNNDDDDDENNDESYYYYPLFQSMMTPYLFLYACPPTQLFRLWFAWMALRLVDLASTTRRTGKPGNGSKRSGSEGTLSRDNVTDADKKNVIHKGGPELETRQHQQTSSSAMGNGAETISCDNASVGSSAQPPPGRYLELLVHNVSHTDFVLSLDIPSSSNNNATPSSNDVDKYCLCRPRFSFFDTYCRMALESLSENEDSATIVNFPRYKRSRDDPRYVIREDPTGTLIPTGFELKPDPHLVANLSEVRVRGMDQAKVAKAQQARHQEEDGDVEQEEDDETVLLGGVGQSPSSSSWATNKTSRRFPIGHVFFPLLATLLPHWQSQIAEKELPRLAKRVLVLVTGVGTPRNFTHSLRGNSTQACAVLMERFLRRIDPGLTVVRIHSETNIFRYDDNLLFVERELMPVLNSYRDTHALGLPYPDEVKTEEMTTKNLQPFNPDWRKSLSVYVSFADGSPARTYAIQASMRPFRPTFFHFWQLKTFWHESKIVDDDLEVHSFEAMETSPPVDTDRLRNPQLKAVVAEMKSFREDMVKALQSGQNDIEKFWLRKTFKPVLAVLLVQSADMEEPVLYRGTNMEVSMPTGSLCAERNVIGTALSANPKLKREDLKMIAVLAVPYTPTIPDTITGGAAGMKRINSTASFTSVGRKISIGSEQEEWVASSSSLTGATSLLLPPTPQRQAREDLASSFAMVGLNDVIVDSSGDHGQSTAATVEASNRQQQHQQQSGNNLSSTPVRKISLFSKSASLPDLMPATSGSNSNNDDKWSKKKPSSLHQRDRHDAEQQHRIHRHQYRQYDKRTVVVHPSTDMNPLAPCGACNEWLKKISESNPYFRIVTFTDADCNGVYCSSCQE